MGKKAPYCKSLMANPFLSHNSAKFHLSCAAEKKILSNFIPILSTQTYETLLKVLKIFKGERHLHPLKEPQLSKRHRLCVVEAQAKQ